ncbi:MAG: oxidoreductase [Lentisphaerae bacterium]|nr:oxidoreductase [Lentisphaerota bacterium]
MKQILQSFKTGEMWLAEVPAPLCKGKGAVVQTAASFVSAGTERMLAEFAKKGIVGKALQMPDQVKKVIRKMKTEGIFATLEKVQAKLDQPIPLGYSSAGVVVEAGRDCGLNVGDRVACGGAGFANHAEFNYVPRNLLVKIPDGVSFEDASCATVGSIALQGVRQCEVNLGETVAVIGLGLLGQLAVQMLRASGCRVIGFDPNKSRCELAMSMCGGESGGVRGAPALPGLRCVSENLVGEAMAFSGGFGVDAVLITAATHSDEPVTVAAEICRKKGRVVATGLVGMNLPRDQYYKKEVDFRLSCSYGPGRYDPVYEEQGVDYPFGYVRWTEQRNMAAFLQLVAEGKVTPGKLVTHRFKFDDALDAYQVLLGIKKEPYLGIVLEYGDGSGLDRIDKIDRIKRRVDFSVQSKNPDNPVNPVRKETIGVSFVGAGNFAKAVLLPTIRSINRKSNNQTILRGVSTATGMSATDTAKKYGFAFAATDQSEVLKDESTNLVFVTTRHDMHAAQIKAALDAGKYVFSEKPLCINEEQLSKLVNPVNPVNPVLNKVMIGFNRRFSPHAKLLKEYFAKRTLPLVMHYRVNAGSIPKDIWLQDPEVGGGRMVGEGCHFIDFMSYVCGAPVEKVQAMCIKTANGAETPEDSISVNLQFADGSVGTLEYVALGDTTLPKEWCEIHGEGSTATMDNFCKTVCSGKLGKRKLKGKQQKGFAEELAATIIAVKNGAAMPIPFEEILNVTKTTFAILKAVKSGQSEEV